MNKIENISWHKIGYNNMPIWLRGLASHDNGTHWKYYTFIEEQIIQGNNHSENFSQGYGLSEILKSSVHQYIIPFIIDFLSDSIPEHKVNLLYLLSQMARYIKFKDGTESDKAKATTLHNIIWGGMSTFIELLDDTNQQVRISAVDLLTQYPEYIEPLLLTFVNTIESENDDRTKAHMTWLVHSSINENNTEFNNRITKYFSQDDYSLLKMTSALCLVDLLLNDAPAEAKNMVLRIHNSLSSSTFNQLPPGYEISHNLVVKLKP